MNNRKKCNISILLMEEEVGYHTQYLNIEFVDCYSNICPNFGFIRSKCFFFVIQLKISSFYVK